MAATYEECRFELYRLCPWLFHVTGTTDSIATGSITDADMLQNSGWLTSKFHGLNIFLPDSAAADRERNAGDLTIATGLLVNRGKNYATTGAVTVQYEIVGYRNVKDARPTPTDLFNLYVRTLKTRLKVKVMSPLFRAADGDMETASVANWTATNSTRAKSQTAANVDSGGQSLVVTNTGANGYVQGPTVSVQPEQQLWVSTAAMPTTATTAQFQLYDVTNSAVLKTVTSAYRTFTVMYINETIPSTCYQVAVRLGGVESNAVVAYDRVVGPYQQSDLVMNVPSWVDATSKLRKVRVARYRSSLGANLYDASSRYFDDVIMPRDAELNVMRAAANPNQLQLGFSPGLEDYWLECLRPAYDLTKLSGAYVAPTNDATGEATTTDLDKEYVAAAWALEVCDFILGLAKDDADVLHSRRRAEEIYDSYQVSEPVETAFRQPTVSYAFSGY